MNMTKEQAYEKIARLVERFSEHVEEYKRSGYNEHQTRIDYINPFFKALGWDIDNEQGYAEAYREVVHEDKIKVGSSTKAPDYGFTLFGQRKFFVDAKKPAINIKSDIAPAFQVRRYGWSAKVPISIVTDFEEFSIYDCTKKPKPTDKASVARIKYITYDQYLDEFDFLWEVFAKENLPKGRFDKYVQSDTRRKGTATVDVEFLKSIEQWRTYLATTIALRNKSLNEDEINYAVQKIIDRILFLRMCEDRGVEQYGKLKKAAEKGNIYQNLFTLYRMADDKYNSGLFDFKEDKITPALTVDNKVMKNIIKELYYPNCEYEFSVMPADILGSVYERFLGKTIRLTKAHYAKIEEKPEVRKAGGVYYTPKYIVDYIVKNTVGKLIEGKTPKQVEKIRICDPACGSGSFLIGAYQFLLEWHLKYYTDEPPKKKKNSPLTPDGNLTTAEKKRILLNNIFGVDIDAQAVEVTKLNLLLKALEGETQASISRQMALFHERVLPNLGSNIKCGNSLIGTDFYDEQIDLFPDQMKKINAFDWEEAFPEIFKQGGFDAVIGNPPYVEFKQLEKEIKDLIEPKYKTARGKYDLFIPFIEKGIHLINEKGLFSYILPSMFTKRDFGKEVRKYITANCSLKKLVWFGDFQVFDQVTVYPFIFVFTKNKKIKNTSIVSIKYCKGLQHSDIDHSLNNPKSNEISDKYTVPSSRFGTDEWDLSRREIKAIKESLENHPCTKKLQEITKYIFVGIQSGKDSVFFVGTETIKRYNLENGVVMPIYRGRDISKYSANWSGTSIIYPYDANTKPIPETTFKKTYPNTYNYLCEKRKELKGRYYFDNSCKLWYELWCERVYSKFLERKIICAEIAPENRFYLDEKGFLGNTKTFNIVLLDNWNNEYYYILGLLNSNLLEFYHKRISVPKSGGFFEYKTQFLNHYPIFDYNHKDKNDKETHDQIAKLASNLCKLHKQLQVTKLDTHRQQIQRTIDHTEKKIDELVYGLYGLSEKEIEIINET